MSREIETKKGTFKEYSRKTQHVPSPDNNWTYEQDTFALTNTRGDTYYDQSLFLTNKGTGEVIVYSVYEMHGCKLISPELVCAFGHEEILIVSLVTGEDIAHVYTR